MNDAISLVETFVKAAAWPLFFLYLLYRFEGAFREILVAMRTRIERGDPFRIGTRGIEFPKLPPKGSRSTSSSQSVEVLNRNQVKKESNTGVVTADGKIANVDELGINLVHTARATRARDELGRTLDQVRIFLVGAEEGDPELDRVEKVMYRHWSLTPPDPVITRRKDKFALELQVWGEFNVTAYIYLKGAPEPVLLQRYINL